MGKWTGKVGFAVNGEVEHTLAYYIKKNKLHGKDRV